MAEPKTQDTPALNIEQIAHILRDTHYGKPISDTEWTNIRKHWLKDAERLLANLDTAGLRIAEKIKGPS